MERKSEKGEVNWVLPQHFDQFGREECKGSLQPPVNMQSLNLPEFKTAYVMGKCGFCGQSLELVVKPLFPDT